ncbi:MAG: putative metalloprotease CJM1_0395 family protein [Thermoguttaceae bacterium]
MQPITNSIFAPTYLTRARYSERPFATTDSQSDAVAASSAVAIGFSGQNVESPQSPNVGVVAQSEKGEKTTERQQSRTPEKSTDGTKQRSSSGDILDISGDSQGSNRSGSSGGSKKSDDLRNSGGSGKPDSLGDSGNSRGSELQSRGKGEGTGSKEQTASSSGTGLTPEQQQQIDKLKSRDAEVRAHEAAHLAAAGQYAKGGASFTFQTGPDGNRYAIGGEVSIDSSAVSGDPRGTIQKAQQIRAAALAPANPSSQDQKVAAAASEMQAKAQMQVMRQSEQQPSAEEEQQGGGVLQIPGTLSWGNVGLSKQGGSAENSVGLTETNADSFSSANSTNKTGISGSAEYVADSVKRGPIGQSGQLESVEQSLQKRGTVGQQRQSGSDQIDSQSQWMSSTERLASSERETQTTQVSSFSPFALSNSERSWTVNQAVSEYTRNQSATVLRKDFLAYA